jgi:hypothetical protein
MTSTDHSRTVQQRLSVPPRRTRPPRALKDDELTALLRVADCLIPESGPNPRPSDTEQYSDHLELALAARADVLDAVVASAVKLAHVPDDELWAALKQLWAEDKSIFDPLSAVVAGAYFMTPQVKALIGYPGQHRNPAPLDQAAEEVGTGLMDPVLERGSIYVSASDA